MYPPAWALAHSTRLDLDEFSAAFANAWSRTVSRFLKLESWQAYREVAANESQVRYDRGDIEGARDLLRREAEADRPLYLDVQRRKIEYARVRIVGEPLTPYLEYEMLSYRIRSEMGEHIEIVAEPIAKLPDERYFDFLLFDGHTALVHDYGSGDVGRQTGGWLTHDRDALVAMEETITELRRRAVPLIRFLATV
ncbi:MAG: hypothetical protein HY241_15105 [Actinobacteria bacterium]|nr:hypothetical protein [Actinomycetota bacterium]